VIESDGDVRPRGVQTGNTNGAIGRRRPTFAFARACEGARSSPARGLEVTIELDVRDDQAKSACARAGACWVCG